MPSANGTLENARWIHFLRDANARRRDAGTKGGRPNQQSKPHAKKKPMVTEKITDGFVNANESITDGYVNADESITNGYANANESITDGYANANESITDGFINADEKITDGYANTKPKEKGKANVNQKAKANGKANRNEKEKRNAKEKENALSFPHVKEREGADAPCADRPRRSLCPTLEEIKTIGRTDTKSTHSASTTSTRPRDGASAVRP